LIPDDRHPVHFAFDDEGSASITISHGLRQAFAILTRRWLLCLHTGRN
jgi:hypothetical protein